MESINLTNIDPSKDHPSLLHKEQSEDHKEDGKKTLAEEKSEIQENFRKNSDQVAKTDETKHEIEQEKGNFEGEPFNYDDILEHLGQLGKFQLRSFLWLCIPALFPAFITMSLTFTGGVPNYRCYIEGCDDAPDSQSGPTFLAPWVNNAIPAWNDDSSESRFQRQCYRYNNTWASLDECYNCTTEADQIQCNKWVYDTSNFESTIVTDFELTCENEWKQPLAGTAFMAGNIFGSISFGWIATKFGRKSAFTLCCLMIASVVTGSAFSPNLITFCILRFFSGTCNIGLFDVYFVWGIEAVGKNYRVICGSLFQLLFTFGSVLLGLIAYFVRDWRIIQIIIGLPIFTFVSLYWIVPESIRWLVATKRYDEARRLILKAAKTNGKSVPHHLLIIPNEQNNLGEKEMAIFKVQSGDKLVTDSNVSAQLDSSAKSEGIVNVLRSSVLLKRLIIMVITWFASVLGYYGITFSANNLSESFYINYELVILVEIPAYFCGMYTTDKLGRRPTLAGSIIISGLACLTTGLVPEDPEVIRIVFSLIGKFFISVVFSVLYTYTVELFPTETRSITMGICSTSGRLGGVLSPFLANAGKRIDPALPYIIFSIFNMVAGVLCVLLPETNNIPLPETIQDSVNMEKYTLSFNRCRNKNSREA